MANTKSAIKAIRQNEKRRVQNRIVRTRTRTLLKKARTAAVTAPGAPTTVEALRQAQSALDRAVSKGIIHRNNAARHMERLMHQFQKAQSKA